MDDVKSKAVRALPYLLAAEARFLTECGYVPITTGVGRVVWRPPGEPGLIDQPTAIEQARLLAESPDDSAKATRFAVGDRIVRNGHSGTIKEIDFNNGQLFVKWDGALTKPGDSDEGT